MQVRTAEKKRPPLRKRIIAMPIRHPFYFSFIATSIHLFGSSWFFSCPVNDGRSPKLFLILR
jgi:hypothetical protein